MTFIGKMLVVVQLVLSLLFMAFAGAVFTVEQNWKTQFDDKKKELKNEKDNHQTTHQEFNQYKTEKEAMVKKFQLLAKDRRNDYLSLKKDTDAKLSQLEDLKTEQATQAVVAKLQGEEAGFRHGEAIEQRRVNKAMHDDLVKSTETNASLSTKLFTLELRLGDNEKRQLVLLDELKTVRLQARRKGRGLGALPSEDIEPPPPLDGKVVSSRYGIGNRILYVEVSVGSDDGIKEGQLLTVFRPGDGAIQKTKYLGQVRIIHVFPDKAVGTVREKAKNGVITKGDNVTSKL